MNPLDPFGLAPLIGNLFNGSQQNNSTSQPPAYTVVADVLLIGLLFIGILGVVWQSNQIDISPIVSSGGKGGSDVAEAAEVAA
jgi:hypothetical protein